MTAAPPRAHRGRVRERRPAARDAGGSRGLQSPLARPSVLNTAWAGLPSLSAPDTPRRGPRSETPIWNDQNRTRPVRVSDPT